MSLDSAVLNRFLEDIHQNECVFKVPANVVHDIQQAVEELVEKLVKKITRCSVYPFFSGSKILKRGSFYEGTKIGLPDEFDFLLELDVLSKPGCLEIISECQHLPGSAHVKLTDPQLLEVNEKLDYPPYKSYLKPITISNYYCRCLQKASWMVFPGDVMDVDWKKNARVDKGCGYLTFREHVSPGIHSRPNTVLELLWTTTTLPEDDLLRCIFLSVDISPAILYVPAGNHSNEVTGKKCHMVPTADVRCTLGGGIKSCCWRYSHSEEELEKMQKLSETHRKIYKILKCVCQKIGLKNGSLRSLTSYILKTAVLHHSDKCNNSDSVGTCTMTILNELYDFAEQGHLPGYFIREKNVWARNHEEKIVTPQPILTKLLKEFETVRDMSPDVYDFHMVFRDFRMLMEEFARIEAVELFVHYINTELECDIEPLEEN